MRSTRRFTKFIDRHESHDDPAVFECRDEAEAKRIRKSMSPRALLGAVVRPKKSTLRQMFVNEKIKSTDFMDHQKDLTRYVECDVTHPIAHSFTHSLTHPQWYASYIN